MNKENLYAFSYSNILNPPPYLYMLDLQVAFTEEGVHVKYNKHFLDREDFSEEDLEDEGLTLNDDIQLEITLNKTWSDYFKQLVDPAKWSNDKPSEDMGNTVTLLFPKQQTPQYRTLKKAEYQLEEVFQAILETAKLEAPLSLFLKKVQNATDTTVALTWYFKDRLFETQSNNKKNALAWEEGQQWLAQFYEIELAALPVHKKKIPEGKVCLNPGDDLWYEIPSDPSWSKIVQNLFPA